MDYLDYLIHEDNDLILQAFCGVSELSDSANRENNLYLLTWFCQVHTNIRLCQGSRDDRSTKLPKTSLQQCANFKNCLVVEPGNNINI